MLQSVGWCSGYDQVQTTSWSKQTERKDRKVQRREVKAKKLKRKIEMNEDELDDLANDARMLKKLKKGKVSRRQPQSRCMELHVLTFLTID